MSYLLDPDSPESSPDHSSTTRPRRTRPPDPYAEVDDALRVPLRPEPTDKARRRESKLGLRNIFGRARGGSDVAGGPMSPRDAAGHKFGALRASLAEISWPYGSPASQGNRSEISLASLSKALPVGPSLKHKKSESIVRQPQTPEGIAAWTPPPLFRAYPQAIKHAHLPACTLPAEVLLRMHHHRTNGSLAALLSPTTSDFTDYLAAGSDKPKRKHRRSGSGSASKFEWTSKVYVLVTSGYLLQYAGEGTYDRLPERVLQLGKDSAAFASDAIPGRHWVLQVSAVAEPDGSHPGSHSSLRARLPFRGSERKHSSTFLMVFDSAEDMESWMATLRREIENLGGRKVLSETGKPKTGTQDGRSGPTTSQRTLVRRDPDRFSRMAGSDDAWKRQSAASSNPDIHIHAMRDDSTHDQPFDDNSTASFISHEGRQLDSLRDSTNRLSYHSSGQRTMMTSVGSSPACSPTRDSFGEFDSRLELSEHEDQQPQPRMRPNAKAIIDRRRSLQAINHVLEMRVAAAQGLRPSSILSDSGQAEAASPFGPPLQPTAPNFSVPHNATNKRHSFGRAPMGMPPTQATTMPPPTRMSARRPPPSALSINPRPLSLVEDQPSPALSTASQTGTTTDETGNPPSTTPVTPPVSLPPPQRPDSRADQREFRDEPIRDSGISTQDRPSSGPAESDAKLVQPSRSPSVPPPDALSIPRAGTSLGFLGESRPTNSAAAKTGTGARRRQSFSSAPASRDGLLSPPIRQEFSQGPKSPALRHVPLSSQHLRLDSESQAQTQMTAVPEKRIVSHSAAEGPPPAPPPNRALPPIPKKSKVNVPPPGFI